MRTMISLLSILVLVACENSGIDSTKTASPVDSSSENSNEKPDDVEPTEAWSDQDNPALFSDELEYNVDALPSEGEATQVPWPSSYWPVYEDSINYKWDGADSLSPAAKYGEAFGIDDFEDQVSEHHGIDKQSSRTECESNSDCNSAIAESCAKREGSEEGYCIPTWWGICHAWAPVAILEPEPQQPVTRNGVEFKVNDIKAIATLAYNRSRSKFVSLRCNEDDSEDEIEYDEYQRPTGDDEECRDTNPGTYHVLLANFLGIKGESFVEDRTFDDQVWNQPLRGYRVTQMEPVTVDRAHELIGVPDDEEPTDSVGGTFGFSGELDQGEWLHKGPYSVIEDALVNIDMEGAAGDLDLYVRFGAEPNEGTYDCRPYRPHSNESCEMTAGEDDTEVYVSIYGYSTGDFDVNVKVQDPNAETTTEAVEYEFNEDAETFYYVKLEVDYMTESESETDGNLADKVDRYTRTDRYQYVLEVDGDNKIIGGEWVGTSKRNHPDFLWLPIERSNWPRPAGGQMNWDLVKELIDASQIAEEPEVEGSTGVVEVTENFELEKGDWKHYGPFEVNGTLEATLSGSGDADLYVQTGVQPTTSNYACRPYSTHSNEECAVEANGPVYVSVNGWQSAIVELNISYNSEAVSEEEIAEEADPTTHLNESSSVDFQEMALYVLEVEDGQKVRVQTGSETDIDLYLRFDNPPTTNEYDERAYTYSGDERIDYEADESGMLHIGVHGWEASDFTLVTSDR